MKKKDINMKKNLKNLHKNLISMIQFYESVIG